MRKLIEDCSIIFFMNLIHPFGLAENQRILSLSPHKPMVESSIKNRAMKGERQTCVFSRS